MTKSDTKADMPAAGRHVYGPRQVAALLPGVTRAAYRRRSPAAAQIMADWAAIVGPALAAVTAPHGLSAGTLTIACGGPVALELAHLTDELRGRVNGHLGRETVKALRFVQTLPAAPPAPTAKAPTRAATERAAAAVAGLPDGTLKDALASLGALVLADQAPDIATRPPPSTRAADRR